MQINIEYTAQIKIDTEAIPTYITSDNQVFIGMEILHYIKNKHQIKGMIITDVDDSQYSVYPMVEVCKFIDKCILIGLNTGTIKTMQHKTIEKKEASEFVLTLKNIVKSKK